MKKWIIGICIIGLFAVSAYTGMIGTITGRIFSGGTETTTTSTIVTTTTISTTTTTTKTEMFFITTYRLFSYDCLSDFFDIKDEYEPQGFECSYWKSEANSTTPENHFICNIGCVK